MAVKVIDEAAVEELDLPGRRLRWVVTAENTGSQYCTMAVIRIEPGHKVRPAHSHPEGEEVIYILTGHGRVMVNGEIASVKAGSAVLFPKGEIHMLQNLSDVEMKVACFFAPPASLSNYKFFDDIDFPDNV
ncbi:MAG: cupin domain-containing protein [Acidobacteria bacterium]|nr:cupin domain-containing protein [Acidobacteriota bacterium]